MYLAGAVSQACVAITARRVDVKDFMFIGKNTRN